MTTIPKLELFQSYAERQDTTQAVAWLKEDPKRIPQAARYLTHQPPAWAAERQKFLDRVYVVMQESPKGQELAKKLSGHVYTNLKQLCDHKDWDAFEKEFERLLEQGCYAVLKIFMQQEASIPHQLLVNVFQRQIDQAAGYHTNFARRIWASIWLDAFPHLNEKKLASVLAICPKTCLAQILKLEDHNTLLHDWVSAGMHGQAIRCLLTAVPSHMHAKLMKHHHPWETPFNLAVSIGSASQMKAIYECSTNKKHFFCLMWPSFKPLFLACQNGDKAKVAFLLEKGRCSEGYSALFASDDSPTPLHECRDSDIVSMVIDAFPDRQFYKVWWTDSYKKNAVDYALQRNDLKNVEKMLKKSNPQRLLRMLEENDIIIKLLRAGAVGVLAKIGPMLGPDQLKPYLWELSRNIFRWGGQDPAESTTRWCSRISQFVQDLHSAEPAFFALLCKTSVMMAEYVEINNPDLKT